MKKNLLNAWVACLLCFTLVQDTRAEESPGRKIVAALQPYVDSGTLAGAVALIATKEKVLTTDAVGFADVEGKVAMKTDAMFWIASMTKPVTATALMMLVDEGKVKLDDPISKYLPEFAGQMLQVEKDDAHVLLKKPAHPATVRNLLNHTSGLLFNSPIEKPSLDVLSLRESSIVYGLTPLQFEPGSKWAYNNAGINMLGRIIEVTSGMPYEEFVQKRIFDPLGMKETTFWPSDEQLKRLAKSYKPNSTKTALVETPIGYLSAPYSNRKRHAFPGGGLFSTAQDMALFCRMILNAGELNGKRYVSADAVKQMGSVQTEGLNVNLQNPNDGGAYGLGWFVVKTQNEMLEPLSAGTFGHAGAFSTIMWIEPAKQRVYILMMQHNGFAGKDGAKVRPAFLKAAGQVFEDLCDVCILRLPHENALHAVFFETAGKTPSQ